MHPSKRKLIAFRGPDRTDVAGKILPSKGQGPCTRERSKRWGTHPARPAPSRRSAPRPGVKIRPSRQAQRNAPPTPKHLPASPSSGEGFPPIRNADGFQVIVHPGSSRSVDSNENRRMTALGTSHEEFSRRATGFAFPIRRNSVLQIDDSRASAPKPRALGKRSGAVAGTNNKVRRSCKFRSPVDRFNKTAIRSSILAAFERPESRTRDRRSTLRQQVKIPARSFQAA